MGTEMNVELLPCPFCGGKAEYEEDWDANYSNRVACTECPATVQVKRGDFSRWNRRAAQPADVGAGELPPLPDGDEYSATRMLPNGELAPRFTPATMRQYARDAIAADRRAREAEWFLAKMGEPRQLGEAEANHEEALQLAAMKRNVSNLARAYLDLRAQLARQSQGEPVRYEACLRSPRGRTDNWTPVEKQRYEQLKANPDAGDGFHWDVRTLYAAPPLSSEQQAEKGEK